MAFNKRNMGYHEPARGVGGSMTYQHPTDTTANMSAAAYWTAGQTEGGETVTEDDFNEVKAFVLSQRLTHDRGGTALTATPLSRQSVPIIVTSGAAGSGGGSSLIRLRMTDTGTLLPTNA